MLFTEALGEDLKHTAMALTLKTKPHGEMGWLVQVWSSRLLGAGNQQSWQQAQLLALAHSSLQ